LRLAITFSGPITIAWAALVNSVTPILARRHPSGLRVEALLALAGLVAVPAWGVISYLVPLEAMVEVTGDAWVEARLWLPWIIIGYSALAASGAAVVGLRARGVVIPALRARVVSSPVLLLGPCGGFVIAGRAGYGVGLVAGGLLTTGLLWRALFRAAGGRR
jgi:hypothetical protein